MEYFASCLFIAIAAQITISTCASVGILYPKSTESRQVLSLNGTWNLRLADVLNPEEGFTDRWYSTPLHEANASIFHVPVPGNLADNLGQEILDYHLSVRDEGGYTTYCPGWAWYERQFSIPESWNENKRIFLRFVAVHYNEVVVSLSKPLPCDIDLVSGKINILLVREWRTSDGTCRRLGTFHC